MYMFNFSGLPSLVAADEATLQPAAVAQTAINYVMFEVRPPFGRCVKQELYYGTLF